MRERPIIYNAEMVRAILNGRKTQTRRIIKPQPFERSWSRHDHQIEIATGRADMGDEIDGLLAYTKSSGGTWHAKCPFGQPGDRLWVRETWTHESVDAEEGSYHPDYRATANGQPVGGKWIPSIHMPRWASRITLEITGVRVERLQDITQADAIAEGGTPHFNIDWFSGLWAGIYGVESWQSNPWVWVVEFRRTGGDS